MGEGTLRVDVDTPSMFLSQSLPVEVRNSRHEVIKKDVSGQSTNLPEGLYSVHVVLPNGERMVQYAQVTEAEPTSLIFEAPTDTARDASGGGMSFAGEGAVELVRAVGCSAEQSSGLRWRFEPEKGSDGSPVEPDAVPTATFAVGRVSALELSIPINPRQRRPGEGRCHVDAVWESDRWRLRTSFDKKRRVANAVDGMERTGELVGGTAIMKQASELLLYKYQDPPGAALGGLTLHRIGQLEARTEWVENLARDFPWLRDGSILLAALLVKDEGLRPRGLDALLDATRDRPMFTDGLSLALDLLRRWPGDARHEERQARIETLAPLAAAADWQATNLTVNVTP